MGNRENRGNVKWVAGLMLLVWAGILYSCSGGAVYDEYHQLTGSKWNKDSVLNFTVNIPDSTTLYNIYFNVRNEGSYPYQNLWLFIKVTPPEGGKLMQDTVELMLANEAGKWYGSGIGDLYDKKYPYKHQVYFPNPGDYTFSVRQGMRSKNGILKGIHDFGFRVEKVN
ncbi:gliding motility lipoprotein GldH [Prolixibacter bellariivorans]|uniref:Gliding motility lipoprotein GldH n=1 Tax=Prolixibacter bellariivorans TaxID=314319 RepID=A0A5M4AYH5_9BACT|nr:gliding motility lipoprotein GldH [Prolixibacter bellariivorans]GET32942.1 gliding motility lipoprotein GldH [Prolixibacter bellariivorans]